MATSGASKGFVDGGYCVTREKNDRTHARVARPYVRDTARTERGAFEEAAVSAAMVALSLAAGFVVGFSVWAVLSLSNWLVSLLWGTFGAKGVEGFAAPWLPLVACTLGGLVIGVWTHFFSKSPCIA